MNCVVTYCSTGLSRTKPGDILLFTQSLARHCPDVRKLMFTAGIHPPLAKELAALGFEFCLVPTEVERSLGKARYGVYLERLIAEPFDAVLHLDCRDVYVQADPFPILGAGLVGCCEGFDHYQCGWNLRDQWQLSRDIGGQENFKQWPVVNASIVGGIAAEFWRWAKAIDIACAEWRTRASEQAVVNRLWHTTHPGYLADPRQGNTFCVTGHCVARIKSHPVRWIDGAACNSDGEPFAIVHQWDRTQWAAEIRG